MKLTENVWTARRERWVNGNCCPKTAWCRPLWLSDRILFWPLSWLTGGLRMVRAHFAAGANWCKRERERESSGISYSFDSYRSTPPEYLCEPGYFFQWQADHLDSVWSVSSNRLVITSIYEGWLLYYNFDYFIWNKRKSLFGLRNGRLWRVNVLLGPHSKDIMCRINEAGSNTYKVEYTPVVPGTCLLPSLELFQSSMLFMEWQWRNQGRFLWFERGGSDPRRSVNCLIFIFHRYVHDSSFLLLIMITLLLPNVAFLWILKLKLKQHFYIAYSVLGDRGAGRRSGLGVLPVFHSVIPIAGSWPPAS